jgi:hypothetical protein
MTTLLARARGGEVTRTAKTVPRQVCPSWGYTLMTHRSRFGIHIDDAQVTASGALGQSPPNLGCQESAVADDLGERRALRTRREAPFQRCSVYPAPPVSSSCPGHPGDAPPVAAGRTDAMA